MTNLSNHNTNNIKNNSAQLKTLRESLGLTLQWVADAANVQLRTAQYWEAGRMSTPKDVIEKLINVELNIQLSVAEALNGYITQFLENYGQQIAIPLIRYRTEKEIWEFHPKLQGLPITTHSIYLSRLKDYLEFQGNLYFLGYFDNDIYKIWLKDREKIDNEVERALWMSEYYGNLSREAFQGILLSRYWQLSNNEMPKNLSADYYGNVIDEIFSYETAPDPKLRLLTFHLFCIKYDLYKKECDRKKALKLSKNLWLLGNGNDEHLFFYNALEAILKLCPLSTVNFNKDKNFSEYFLKPIEDFLSDENQLKQEKLLKIISIGEIIIRLMLYPEQLGIKSESYAKKQVNDALQQQIKAIFSEKNHDNNIGVINAFIRFLENKDLINERIRSIINGIDPQYSAQQALKKMKWHHSNLTLPLPTIKKSSLKEYVTSCKQLVCSYFCEKSINPVTGSTLKIYDQDKENLTTGIDHENFNLIFGKSLLNHALSLIDFSLSNDQQELFESQLNTFKFDKIFLNTMQVELLKRSVILGLRGYYMEAAFLLMPYIECLLRNTAIQKGWNALKRNGDQAMPDKDALKHFLDEIINQDKQFILKMLYTTIYEAPNKDIYHAPGKRIGDNLRNLSFHGLMDDSEIFDPKMQAKYIAIWLMTTILALE